MKAILLFLGFLLSAPAFAGFTPKICATNTIASVTSFSIQSVQYGTYSDARTRPSEAFFVRYRNGASKLFVVIHKVIKNQLIAYLLKDMSGEVSISPRYFYASLNPDGSIKGFFGEGTEDFKLSATAQACH